MSRFTEVVQEHTSRLVVEFSMVNGNETFKWGVVGHIPILSLIGALSGMQEYMAADGEEDDGKQSGAPDNVLVIVWHSAINDFEVFIGTDIPPFSLVGMLEIIKTNLVAAFMARSMASMQPPIYGPDGQPMFRG